MRYVSVSLGLPLTTIALALWWGGFAPFPTKPVALASWNTTGLPCAVAGDNWALCSPGLNDPMFPGDRKHDTPEGSLSDFRLFSGGYKRANYGEYGQWGIEGFNGCWDDGCSDFFHNTDVVSGPAMHWKIYYRTVVPHFGLGTPKWVMTLTAIERGEGATYAKAVYTTYGACMYRKPADSNDEYYECKRIEAGDPWVVGKTHGLWAFEKAH